MTSLDSPLGFEVYGQSRLGDGYSSTGGGGGGGGGGTGPGNAALPLSGTIQTAIRNALPLSGSILAFDGAGLILWGYIGVAEFVFSINGIIVPKPTEIGYYQPTEVGNDQLGVPIIQGAGAMVWSYDVLLDNDMSTIMGLYDPANPQVTIVYPNEYGFWVTKQCMFQPPNLGTRTTIQHAGVQLTFTNILPS